MKRLILLIATSFLIASPLHAVPLTWHFFGTTSSSSQYNGMSIGGLDFELQIFLDTDVVGIQVGGLADVIFEGPFQGDVAIAGLGVLPTSSFRDVQYLVIDGDVFSVQFDNSNGRSYINFDSAISADGLHLSPIAPSTPNSFNSFQGGVSGPNGLFFSGVVTTFSAVLGGAGVPEGGSTALLLTLALLSLGFLSRRMQGAAP